MNEKKECTTCRIELPHAYLTRCFLCQRTYRAKFDKQEEKTKYEDAFELNSFDQERE